MLVETNICNSENNIYNKNGFNSSFLNREDKGGGIVVYIKENINYAEISINTNSFESLQINININEI